MEIAIKTPTPTMSSRDIAELTCKQHKHVMVDIGKMLVDLEEDEPSFRRIYFDSMNREQREYRLNRELTDTLLTGYSAKARRAVISRWRDLEYGNAAPIKPSQPSALSPAKEFRAIYGIARLIGLDKNAAAMSANQAVSKLTGTNMLALLGQTHLDTPDQKLYYTPTELGQRLGGISGRKVNMLLAKAGLQAKHGDKWEPLKLAEGMHRVLDTGKSHGDGTMVQQIKWADDVLDMLHQPKELAKETATAN